MFSLRQDKAVYGDHHAVGDHDPSRDGTHPVLSAVQTPTSPIPTRRQSRYVMRRKGPIITSATVISPNQ